MMTRKTICCAMVMGIALQAVPARGQTAYTFTKTAIGTYNWNAATNWIPAASNNYPRAVGDQARVTTAIPATGTVYVDLNEAVTSGVVRVGQTAGNQVDRVYNIRAGTAGSLTIDNTGAGPALLDRSTAGDAVDTISAPVILTDHTLVANTYGTIIISGTISGPGSLARTTAVAATGTLRLDGTNAFTGGVTMDGGILELRNAAALGTTAGTLTLRGGCLNAGVAGVTLGNYPQTWAGNWVFLGGQNLHLGSGAVTLTAPTVADVRAGTLTAGGPVGDGGTGQILTKADVGTLHVAGALSQTGPVNVQGGVLRFNWTGGFPANANLRLDGGVIANDTVTTFTGTLGAAPGKLRWVGHGGFAAYGTGLTVNIGGAGATMIWGQTPSFVASGKELILGAGGADQTVTWQNPIQLTSGSTATRTLRVANGTAAVDATITAAISDDGNAGGFVQAGAGRLDLTAANTFSGIATVKGGTLALSGANGALGTVSKVVLNGNCGLTLDNAAAANGDRVPDSRLVVASNSVGTLTFAINTAAGSFGEMAGVLDLNRSSFSYVGGQASATQTSTFTFGGLSRSDYATAFFRGTGLGADARNRVLITGQAAGDMGPWAVYSATANITDFAAYDAVNGVKAATSSALTAGSDDGTLNWKMAGGNITVAAVNPEYKTLAISDATARTFNANSNTVYLVSGGLAVQGAVHIVDSGVLTTGPDGGTSVPLYVHNSSTLNLKSTLADNAGGGAMALVKSGAGQLTLTNSVNAFSGDIAHYGGVFYATWDRNDYTGVGSLGAVNKTITIGPGATFQMMERGTYNTLHTNRTIYVAGTWDNPSVIDPVVNNNNACSYLDGKFTGPGSLRIDSGATAWGSGTLIRGSLNDHQGGTDVYMQGTRQATLLAPTAKLGTGPVRWRGSYDAGLIFTGNENLKTGSTYLPLECVQLGGGPWVRGVFFRCANPVMGGLSGNSLATVWLGGYYQGNAPANSDPGSPGTCTLTVGLDNSDFVWHGVIRSNNNAKRGASNGNQNGGLIKAGTGTMTITQMQDYNRVTVVTNGTLRFEGGGVPAGLNVGPDGAVGGVGTVVGDLNVNGGKLKIELRTDSGGDRLTVSGTATVTGTIEVTLADGFRPTSGTVFTILSAGTLNPPTLAGVPDGFVAAQVGNSLVLRRVSATAILVK